MGFNDARRGVMGYYDLAREARLILTNLKKATPASPSPNPQIALWESRLQELGIHVASALVEMEDLEGAARHLISLKPTSGTGELGFQKALLWLYIGDISAARSCISKDGTRRSDKVIQALSLIADSEPAAAVPIWEELIAESPSGSAAAMYRQNLAVCYLYLGRLADVCSLAIHITLNAPHLPSVK